jgi:hypothetical protein
MLAMKRSTLTIPILALGCLLLGEVSLHAQYPPYGGNTQPMVSPYLNMLRQGATPGANFYTLVRPQLGFFQGIGNLQQQGQLNQQLITGLGVAYAGAPTTGQPFGFQTHLGYFQNQLRAGGLGGGAGGGIVAGQPGVATGGPAGFGLGGFGGANPGGGATPAGGARGAPGRP